MKAFFCTLFSFQGYDHINPVEYSLLYYKAPLKEAKVPVEMHLYPKGGHGFGLRKTNLPVTSWTGLVAGWLKTIGVY